MSMPDAGEQVDLQARGRVDLGLESKRPRTVSSAPQAVNTPPMMRRRSNRFAARSAGVGVRHVSTSYQNARVRIAAPASTPDPSSFGDSHHA